MTFLNFRDQEHPIRSYEQLYTKFTNQLISTQNSKLVPAQVPAEPEQGSE